jgi:hypothetical protein
MGLDQYAYAREIVKDDEEAEPVDIDIAYWRKHNRLEGWMENLYRDKHPDSNREFNCVDLELTEEDINRLEKDVITKSLPRTQGFFFGEDSYNDEEWSKKDMEKDLQFINDARQYLKDGYKIIYSSWW